MEKGDDGEAGREREKKVYLLDTRRLTQLHGREGPTSSSCDVA